MHLKTLTKNQIKDLYNDRLIIDFPPAELKPLPVILDAVDKGIYEGLGLYDGEEMVGYSCLVKQADNYLVDYLAIFSEKRNSGIGSNLIKLLAGYLDGTGSVIVEVEDPQYGSNDEDRDLRARRLSFYLRNGCFDTGVRVRCFGVEFIILKMGNTEIEKEMCWDIYSSFYKAVLPEGMYDENIELLGYMNGKSTYRNRRSDKIHGQI